MSISKSATTPRAILDELLGRPMARELWTGNFEKALPLSVQDFDLSAILPAVFYMFRFGQRRGKGKFVETFGLGSGTTKEQKKSANIERVSSKLSETARFQGVDGDVEQAILGDLLLCYCLENRKHALGRKEQIQRVAPAHYMASWIDLPESVANLRYVPEMVVATLANQDGEYVVQNKDGDRTWFAVGRGFEENVLLRAFHRGIKRQGPLGSLTSDRFIEDTTIGLDQLLMIGLAQQVGSAPEKLRGGEGEKISNQRPIAERAGREFSEDIRRFVRAYADVIPRHAFVEMLESCMAVGLTTILTSVAEILFYWAITGEIRKTTDQKAAFLFVDCSNGVDRRLRTLSEQSTDDYLRRLERLPVIFMALRLLDRGARYDPKIKKLNIPTKPYAIEWINILGDLLNGRREESHAILYELARKAQELGERIQEEYLEAARILQNDGIQPNPVWRLSEALTALQGRRNTQGKLMMLFDSALLTGYRNGLGIKRATIRQVREQITKKRQEMRSIVLSDSVLDYLVHLHVLKAGNTRRVRPISLQAFLRKINERYGFCVDMAPPGMNISNDLLQTNRAVLERRFRDLGLLLGVNDAETMKRLWPRFEPAKEDDNDLD
jgi:hypothetical protein